MADDSRFRSTRPGVPYRRASGPSRPSEGASASDPLAELARLIGKNDPYAEFGLSNSPAQAQQEDYPTATSAHDDWRHAPAHERYEEPYHDLPPAHDAQFDG